MASETRKTIPPCDMEECKNCDPRPVGARFEVCEGCNCYATTADGAGDPLCRACLDALIEAGPA